MTNTNNSATDVVLLKLCCDVLVLVVLSLNIINAILYYLISNFENMDANCGSPHLDTRRKLNVYKTFRRRPVRCLMYVQFMFFVKGDFWMALNKFLFV